MSGVKGLISYYEQNVSPVQREVGGTNEANKSFIEIGEDGKAHFSMAKFKQPDQLPDQGFKTNRNAKFNVSRSGGGMSI